MKLTLRGEYALRALAVLALHPGQLLKIHFISAQQNIPKRFLEQILNDLRSAGWIESKRGMAGGYRIKVPPEQIKLTDIIRYIEGALAPVSCVSERFYERCSCPDETRCGIRSVMKEVREAIVTVLDQITLAELCDRFRRLQGAKETLDYTI